MKIDPREAFIAGAFAESLTTVVNGPMSAEQRYLHMSMMFDEWASGRWPARDQPFKFGRVQHWELSKSGYLRLRKS